MAGLEFRRENGNGIYDTNNRDYVLLSNNTYYKKFIIPI